MNTEHVLKAQGLSVHYGGIKANENISLHLLAGEVHGLIGPNGAGKSTFIDALSGRIATTTGKVYLRNDDITDLDVVQRRLRGLSRSFQRTNIFMGMRVGEQVALAALKIPGTHPDEIIQKLALEHLVHHYASDMAYGDQRRLDIALALIGRPDVLLLDEPMAGLSIEESWKLAEHLRDLAKEWDVSVLLVEHDMEVVFGLSDRITVLETGRVLAEGSPAEIRAHPKVREAYLGSTA